MHGLMCVCVCVCVCSCDCGHAGRRKMLREHALCAPLCSLHAQRPPLTPRAPCGLDGPKGQQALAQNTPTVDTKHSPPVGLQPPLTPRAPRVVWMAQRADKHWHKNNPTLRTATASDAACAVWWPRCRLHMPRLLWHQHLRALPHPP